MSKETPVWLPEARESCRNSGIEIEGWGADTLLVKAESPERAKQVASQLRFLGLEPIEDEDDAEAGMLLLSRNPAATRAKQKANRVPGDLSRMPVIARVGPVFTGLLSIFSLCYSATQSPPISWRVAVPGSIVLIYSLWEGSRVWGWRLEMSPEELRVRYRFQWTAIPWTQIRAVKTETSYNHGAAFVTVTLTRASKPPLRLGTFGEPFARGLRDRLRKEIAQRQCEPK